MKTPAFHIPYTTKKSGVTLVELMVTVAILAIGVLAGLASFRYIATSIQNSKTRTLSNNIAQEQIEKLKNLQYYSLLVTTSTIPGGDTRFSPPLIYDNSAYPVQTLVVGGASYQRATRVDFAFQNGTAISTAPWTNADTGLKEIVVYAMYQDASGWHYQEMRNLMANPAANPLNATFTGWVRDPSSNNIGGALVKVLDNSNWFGFANASGQYQFSVSQGSYTLQCSSQGYFPANSYQSIATGQPLTVNFTLTVMSTGTAQGYVYRDDHLVISQVVASTDSPTAEYLELYNPTTTPINIGSTASPHIAPFFLINNNPAQTIGPLTYVSTYVAVNSYYLIANQTVVHASNATRSANAYYAGTIIGQNVGGANKAGGISIANSATDSPLGVLSARIDGLGWSHTACGGGGCNCPDGAKETSCLANPGGLGANEQVLRRTDAGAPPTPGVGRAYDSNNNLNDWVDQNPMTI